MLLPAVMTQFDTSKLNSTNEVTAETISGATALATGAASVDHAVRSTTPEDNGTPSMQAGASKGNPVTV